MFISKTNPVCHLHSFEPISTEEQSAEEDPLFFASYELTKELNDFEMCELLSKVYEINFFLPQPGVDLDVFFGLRDQILSIERLAFERSVDKHTLFSIRTSVINILVSSLLFKDKIAELGMILFFIDRDSSLSVFTGTSFVARRTKELLGELKQCTSDPTYCLLLRFAQMAVTSNQTFNRGGVACLIEMLLKPRIASYLLPEHLKHILTVAHSLFFQPQFAQRFKKHLFIPPPMQEMIRKDLHLSFNDRVSSAHGFLDSLVALFFDIRQGLFPNCYIVASIGFAAANSPYNIFCLLLNWIEKGAFLCGNGVSIPIYHFLEQHPSSPNALANLLITLTEFQFINDPSDQDILLSLPPRKKHLITFLVKKIAEQKIAPKRDLHALEIKMNRTIWVENLPSQSIIPAPQALFFWDRGFYFPIKKITDLQYVLESCLSKTASKTKIWSLSFSLKLAEYASCNVGGILKENFKKMNLFLLRQQGGLPEEVLKKILGMQVGKKTFFTQNAYQFLLALFFYLKSIKSSFFRTAKKFLLVAPGHHAWSLQACDWYFFFEKEDFEVSVKKSVFDRASVCLNALIPFYTMKTILESCFKEEHILHRRISYFKQIPNLTYQKFQTLLLQMKSSEETRRLIDLEFSKVPVQELNLEEIGKYLALSLRPTTIKRIKKILTSSYSSPQLPHVLAYAISKQLMQLGIAIISPFKVERALCDQMGLPIPFDMGDLNWQRVEIHDRAVIRYNWVENQLKFYNRTSKQEFLESSAEYKEIELLFPKW